MTPDERRACLAALDAARAAVTAMQDLLDRHDGAAPEGDDLVPLKVAADAWGISDAAALKRAKRGAATRVGKRWYVRRSDLNVVRSR